jgi:methylaspartate mutase sigma subunit
MPADFVEAALEVDADALLIGSLNGEAPHWCAGLRRLLDAVGLGHLLVYLGGNLVTGEMPAAEVERLFRSRGIDRVYYGTTDFDVMIADLKKDLSRGRAAA